MLSISRRTETGRPRRSRGALALSLALNAVAIGVFFQALTEGYRWSDLLDRRAAREAPAERIAYVQVPRATSAVPQRGRSGGDGRPVTRTPTARPAPIPAAPTTVPDAIPAPAPAAEPVDQGGSGAVVGSGGATAGIEPTYGDARLWGRPGLPVAAPKTAKQRLDSVIADRFGAARDSVLAASQLASADARRRGDWTKSGAGGKWGVDTQNIYLGKVKIPNAILALLSENIQRSLRGNPIQQENDRRLASIRADLMMHAEREQNEDLFRNAVKEIRARKDRERAARMADQKGTVAEPER